MNDDDVVRLVALVIAEVIVAVGWLAILVVSIVLVNRRVNRIAPPGTKMEAWGWLVGAACFCFWPMSIVLGILFLRDPKMARVGRACAFGGLLNVSFAVVIAEIVTAVIHVKFPEYLPR